MIFIHLSELLLYMWLKIAWDISAFVIEIVGEPVIMMQLLCVNCLVITYHLQQLFN